MQRKKRPYTLSYPDTWLGRFWANHLGLNLFVVFVVIFVGGPFVYLFESVAIKKRGWRDYFIRPWRDANRLAILTIKEKLRK